MKNMVEVLDYFLCKAGASCKIAGVLSDDFLLTGFVMLLKVKGLLGTLARILHRSQEYLGFGSCGL